MEMRDTHLLLENIPNLKKDLKFNGMDYFMTSGFKCLD